jgi:RNA polymerase sigma-70 factor (ECF subfamily)
MSKFDAGSPIADRALVAAARLGDEMSQNALVEQAWPHAYRMARAVLRSHDVAEDVAQDVCVQMLRCLATLREDGSFDAWLMRIVTRTISRVRRTRREDIAEIPADIVGRPQFGESTMDLRRGIDALNPNLRLVLILDVIYGYNSAEIGRALGIPSPTVRYRLFRARAILRDCLSEDPIPPSAAYDYDGVASAL